MSKELHFKNCEERKNFFLDKILDYDTIIGCNGTRYMINKSTPTHFGHQHVMYPWSWLNPLIKMETFQFIGIWHNFVLKDFDENGKIIHDYFDLDSNVHDDYNWNGAIVDLEKSMSIETRSKLLSICVYKKDDKIKNYIIVKLEK